jgi:hypothetical protein
VIPYKNPPALTAYYLGLFSLFPFLGAVLGVVAVVLGIMGLRKKRETPEVKGSVHAWVGIGCGSLGFLFWALILGIMIFAAVTEA